MALKAGRTASNEPGNAEGIAFDIIGFAEHMIEGGVHFKGGTGTKGLFIARKDLFGGGSLVKNFKIFNELGYSGAWFL